MSDKVVTAPGYNLVTLMKRLEAATSRLEDLTEIQAEAVRSSSSGGKSVTIQLPDSSSETSKSETPQGEDLERKKSIESDPPALKDFDEFVADFVEPFTELSKNSDPVVGEQSSYLAKAFAAQRDFLATASKAKKPDPQSPAFAELLKPLSSELESIIAIRENNRTSKYINHLAAVAEGVPSLGWVAVDAPVSFIGDFRDSAQFYANRVLKEYKDVDKKQVEWVQSLVKLFGGLQAYVKKHHATGPWNVNGKTLEEIVKDTPTPTAVPAAAPAAPPTAAPTSDAGAPPPPPPPPLPPASTFTVADTSASSSSSSGGINAVFAELNKGEAVTSGLRKVDKSEMTHKNPALRASSTASSGSEKKHPVPPKKPASLSLKKKPARKELVDTKWIVENFEDDHEIVIEAELNQGIFIDTCNNCTIQIKGKANAITINGCTKVGVVAHSLVSGVDIIKCKKFGFQATGKVPTVQIDQSHDGQVYLGQESLDAEIYTSQTTALNISIPDPKQDGDFLELALPEQLVHKVVNNKIVSSIVEHSG